MVQTIIDIFENPAMSYSIDKISLDERVYIEKDYYTENGKIFNNEQQIINKKLYLVGDKLTGACLIVEDGGDSKFWNNVIHSSPKSALTQIKRKWGMN